MGGGWGVGVGGGGGGGVGGEGGWGGGGGGGGVKKVLAGQEEFLQGLSSFETMSQHAYKPKCLLALRKFTARNLLYFTMA